jgi:glycosyltransferase involved in cell wall biosynthesis
MGRRGAPTPKGLGKRVRVGIDVTAVPARPTGAGQYTLALATAVAARADVEVTLWCRRGDDGRWAMVAPQAKVIAAAPQHRPMRLAWEQTVMPLRLRRSDIQVMHSPHYTMPERARLPRVVTIHDMTFFDHPEWHERSKVPVFRRAIKIAAERATALICVSEQTAARLRDLLAPKVPVHVVHHGVDHERFRPLADTADRDADDKALSRLGLGPTIPFIAFVGTIEPRKSVDHLVRAFDRMAGAHPELRLVLAGTDGWGVADVTAAITAARHGDRVLRTGYVPDDAVPALLRRAAAVAYPAYQEGFGLPALEALACGAPLVTTKGSVMEEVVGAAALLVNAGDTAGLAGALDMLVRGDARLAGRRALGHTIAAQHTWERCAEGHVAVYREAAGTGR